MASISLSSFASKLDQELSFLWAVYLFGSHASNQAMPDSDVDLAVLGKSPYTAADLFNVSSNLAVMLKRNVDLVDLRAVPTDLQAQIVTKGQRHVLTNFEQIESFEDFVYSSYARLNEERKYILADIQQRGSVYGR
jgi:predicted nucleotidyltransferase